MKKKLILLFVFSISVFGNNLVAQEIFMSVYDNGELLFSRSVNETDSITFEEKTFENGHEYVDLGLSVKWATCNVGATTPEGYGNHYAWGELVTKSNNDWTTYKYCDGAKENLTKYSLNESYGVKDYKAALDSIDDVASVLWGGSWRMPTKKEMEELLTNCTLEYDTRNGVNGYTATSKRNGNSIFFPAAGYRPDESYYDGGSLGYYWTKTLYISWPVYAYFLELGENEILIYQHFRCAARSVRAVCP